MEIVFKKEDRVYCILYGWGCVLEVCDKGSFPVQVFFDCGEQIDYTKDGRLYDKYLPTLSFTEYTLQGFSQERPIELPEVGDWCLVRDSKHTVWQAGLFKEYKNNNEFPFVTDIGNWKQMKRIKILD